MYTLIITTNRTEEKRITFYTQPAARISSDLYEHEAADSNNCVTGRICDNNGEVLHHWEKGIEKETIPV